MASTIETDYLIVGTGASGMAFADMMVTHSESDMVLVDRRHAPGGHWVDAYPFARLHMPSTIYGVDSTGLGAFGCDPEGDESLFERATAGEICGYYDRVLNQRLIPSGRVRYMSSTDYLGDGLLRSLLSGEETTVRAAKVVDATYLEGTIPATTPPPFEVADEACCIPIGELVAIAEPPDGYVVIGAGKTGQDACLWLLAAGVAPESIRWVRPRDPWLQTRRSAQPGPGIPDTIDIYSRSLEAAAKAESVDDLFERLEDAGAMTRIDPTIKPSCYQGAIISDWQVTQLRRIDQVIRRGHVHRIERDQIVFDEGTVPTTPGTVHVHCAVPGLAAPPAIPVFDGERITIQNVRYGLIPYSASIIAFVEAAIDGDAEKNALCHPRQFTGRGEDWMMQRLADLDNSARWQAAPDLLAWMNGTRLNMTAGMRDQRDNPVVDSALRRFAANAETADQNLRRLEAEAYA